MKGMTFAVAAIAALSLAFGCAQRSFAQTGGGDAASSNTSAPAKPDAGKKQKPEQASDNTKTASVKPKAGQYATEAEAQAHCRGGTVVWTDRDNFHHYPGSREYGRKPGAFICSKE